MPTTFYFLFRIGVLEQKIDWKKIKDGRTTSYGPSLNLYFTQYNSNALTKKTIKITNAMHLDVQNF